ncbi:MAG: hypothetical protein JWO67_1948 [Streptosporangiaceae bacterium]|nr:hypothetical protein [Streptosporangiaceae bacterium]
MDEIKQTRTTDGVGYMERQWHISQARSTVQSEMDALGRAWQALDARAESGEADQGEVTAEARRLIGDTLTAQRSVATWFGKVDPPPWVVDDGHVVLGALRVPLTVDLLAGWMKGETG